MKLQSISQPIHNIFAFATQSIRNHPITATAVTTLFLATVVKATPQSDLKDTEVTVLNSFTDWLAKDTEIKIGTFALVLLTAAVLWKVTRSKAPIQVARTADDNRVRTGQIKKTEQKRPGSAPDGTALPRPHLGEREEREATIGKGQAPRPFVRAVSNMADVQSFQQRLLDHGIAETPGGINLTPFQMKENGEKDLRSTFIYPQQHALLSYTLAAHSILLGNLLAAKAEGIKGYKSVEFMRGEIKSDLRSLIEQCKFLITESQQVQEKKRAEGSQSLRTEIPETPGGVNLSPLQMKVKGEAALRGLFTSPVQNALLCYTLAADLMIEGKYDAAKVEIKKGWSFVKSSKEQIKADLHAQYLACKALQEQPLARQSTAHRAPESKDLTVNVSSILSKPLPIPPKEEEAQDDETDANSIDPREDERPLNKTPIRQVPQSPQQTAFGPPSPPKISIEEWHATQAKAKAPNEDEAPQDSPREESKTPPSAVETKRPIPKKMTAPSSAVETKRPIPMKMTAPLAIDPSMLPPPPVEAPKDLPANTAPPPTPSKLPPPPAVMPMSQTHSRARSSSVDGVETQSTRLVFDPKVLQGVKKKLQGAPATATLEDKVARRQELESADAKKVENPKRLVLAEIKKPQTLKKAPPPKTKEEKLAELEEEKKGIPVNEEMLKRRAAIEGSDDDSNSDWSDDETLTKNKIIQTPAKSRNGNNIVE